MKTSYDAETDALFVRLTDGEILDSEEVSPDVIVDFDKDGHVVGFEILNAKDRLGERFVPSEMVAA